MYTATSTDGFAMRHIALLSDDALTLASQLFECMDMLGTIPQQLRYVLVVLIPKANNGFEAHWNLLCALPLVGKVVARPWRNLGKT